MKNATKHADTLKSLLRSLLREGKPPPFERQDPLKALIKSKSSHFIHHVFASLLFLTLHCRRQFARVWCELQTWQPTTARSATHTK